MPKFEKGSIDRDSKIDNVPGIDSHVNRMKNSQREYNRKRQYFENLGSKYRGETTTPQPFSFVHETNKLKSTESLSPERFHKIPKARPVSETSKSPVKRLPTNQKSLTKKKVIKQETNIKEETKVKEEAKVKEK